MPPYMPIRFGIVERRYNHIAKKKGLSLAGAFSFFHIFFRIFFSFSSTFSSFLGSVFQSLLAILGYVIVEV